MTIVRKARPEPDPKDGLYREADWIRCDICGAEQEVGISGWWNVSRQWNGEVDLCRVSCLEAYAAQQREAAARYHEPGCVKSDEMNSCWSCSVPVAAGTV